MVNNFHPKDKLSKDFFDNLKILLTLHSTFRSFEYDYDNPPVIDRLNYWINQGQLPDVFSTIQEILNEIQSRGIDTKALWDYFNNFSTKIYAYSDINELKCIFPKQEELSLYELRANNKLILKDYLGITKDIEYVINLTPESEASSYTIYNLYNIAAQAHHKLGNFQKSIYYYTKNIEDSSKDQFKMYNYNFRMEVYIDSENYQQAIQDCISVINLGFATTSKYEVLGDLYLKSGNKQEAIVTYKKFLAIYEQQIEEVNAKGKDPFNSLKIYTDSQQELLLKIKSLESNSVANNQTITSQPTASGDCFIVTATFGTPYATEVVKYRNFRDQYLSNYLLGRGFIYLYNFWGPGLAIIVNKNPRLKGFMAKVLGTVSQVLPETKDYII